MVYERLQILLEQLDSRQTKIPRIQSDEEINWPAYHEEIKGTFETLSHFPREIEQYLHVTFQELPSTIPYTPNTIDLNIENITTSNIQLQSNLIHLLEQEVHSQIQTIVDPLHQKYTIFFANFRRDYPNTIKRYR